jgi:hypothetical protein
VLVYIYIYQVKENELDRACNRNREKRNIYRIFVGKTEGKRLLGRPRRSWVCNIKMDLRAIEWDGMDLIDLADGGCHVVSATDVHGR